MKKWETDTKTLEECAKAVISKTSDDPDGFNKMSARQREILKSGIKVAIETYECLQWTLLESGMTKPGIYKVKLKDGTEYYAKHTKWKNWESGYWIPNWEMCDRNGDRLYNNIGEPIGIEPTHYQEVSTEE